MASIFNIIRKSTEKGSGKKKVLLLGAEGMLGRDIFNVLYNHYDVVGKNRRDTDVTLISDVSRAVNSVKPDYVINASAYTKVDEAEDHKEEAFRINCEAMKYISFACKEAGSVLVHFSTDYVFDGNKGGPYTEEDEPFPVNYYGETKLKGEIEVVNSNCDHLIIRTQWLFGPHGKNFVFAIIDKLKKDRTISVVDDQIGCPTYTVDLARATKKLMEVNQRGVFHYSGEGETTWFGFAKKISDLCIPEEVEIAPVKSSEIPFKAKRPHNSVLSKEKYRKTVGENPRRWEEMLRDFLKRTYEAGVAW